MLKRGPGTSNRDAPPVPVLLRFSGSVVTDLPGREFEATLLDLMIARERIGDEG
jgi:hypothetical protein